MNRKNDYFTMTEIATFERLIEGFRVKNESILMKKIWAF